MPKSQLRSKAEGEGFETLGRRCRRQRFSRPRRNGRNAASQLESASRGNTGGNEFRREGLGYQSAAERDSAARMGKRRSAGQWAALLHLVHSSSRPSVGVSAEFTRRQKGAFHPS